MPLAVLLDVRDADMVATSRCKGSSVGCGVDIPIVGLKGISCVVAVLNDDILTRYRAHGFVGVHACEALGLLVSAIADVAFAIAEGACNAVSAVCCQYLLRVRIVEDAIGVGGSGSLGTCRASNYLLLFEGIGLCNASVGQDSGDLTELIYVGCGSKVILFKCKKLG